MKRDPQTFAWNCVDGVLTVTRRSDNRTMRTYDLANYPDAIRGKITDAGFKAVFQQRTSQIDDDAAKLIAWDELDELFVGGTWEREGTRGAPIVGAWVEVLAEVKGTEVGAIQKALAGYAKEQRDAIRKSVEEKYAVKIAALKAARTADAVDLSDLT